MDFDFEFDDFGTNDDMFDDSGMDMFDESKEMDDYYNELEGDNNSVDSNYVGDDFEADVDTGVAEHNGMSSKKIAIISAICGISFILFAFGCNAIGKTLKAKRTGETSNNKTVQTQVVNKQSSTNGSWIEINNGDNIEFTGKNSSEITVSKIKSYAKVCGENGEMLIKSVASGYISGLTGVYEVDIPYSKSGVIKPGTVLKIEYTYAVRNDDIIVGEIKFK